MSLPEPYRHHTAISGSGSWPGRSYASCTPARTRNVATGQVSADCQAGATPSSMISMSVSSQSCIVRRDWMLALVTVMSTTATRRRYSRAESTRFAEPASRAGLDRGRHP
jgi:hypothetical protein